MSEPSSRSRALLDGARAARLTAATRDRMEAALAARIGTIGAGTTQPSPPAPPLADPAVVSPPAPSGVATTSIVKLSVVGAMITALTVAAIALWPSARPPASGAAPSPASSIAHTVEPVTPPTPIVAVAPSAGSAGVPTEPLPSSAGLVESLVPGREARAIPPHTVAPPPDRARLTTARAVTPARRAIDVQNHEAPLDVPVPAASAEPSLPIKAITLGEETAMLAEAERSLKEGNGAEALAVLDELAARHPTGLLREERLAARVLALCAAGRVDEAREAGQRFVAEMPGSVQTDRIRTSCAFSSIAGR